MSVAVLEVVINLLLQVGLLFAASTATAVILVRLIAANAGRQVRRIQLRYGELARRAAAADPDAAAALVACPARHRLDLAALLINPLIADRNPARIERTRAIVRAMGIVPIADRYLRSWWWWRRALALRALGLLQMTDHTAEMIRALDDPNADVRAAALDALRDVRNRAALQAVVARLNDPSLPPGRRAAALAAFGSECEPFVVELIRLDPMHRAHYIRALAACGSSRSRRDLCRWTNDSRSDVQAAAFEALAHIGLDRASARRAIECLQHQDPEVRAMAAFALHGWSRRPDATRALARHLEDVWSVAVRAAQSLRSAGPKGLEALRASVALQGVAGLLARQMLWEEVRRC